MGIDIYMNWKDQTNDEKQAQYTGFNIESGDVGYLREAYHGEPYATRYLVKEAFESDGGEAYIPSTVLRERLQETLKLHIEREREIYREDVKETDPSAKAFTDFVELAEKMTAEGNPPSIIASY